MSEILPAIVVIAYNRDDSLKRLLEFIEVADYSCANNENIPLIISIDKSDNERVALVAKDFKWEYGDKIIVEHEERLGLVKHVLECSAYSVKYKSAIILEDDLCVAKGYYEYTKRALEFTQANPDIAGVSLYNHLLNVHARKPFEAINDGYDNWYFQFASSWGQAYTASQWEGFYNWYIDNKDMAFDSDIPANVSGWGDSSWLKFYIAYVIKTNKYFLYPRISLSSNFAQAGTHMKESHTDLQVPMLMGNNKNWRFSPLNESGAVYDSFFENKGLTVDGYDNIEIDLYGYKGDSINKRYILSSKPMPYKIVKSFGRILRPMDMNILLNQPGNDLFLYDTNTSDKVISVNRIREILYNYRAFKASYGIDIIKKRIKDRIK